MTGVRLDSVFVDDDENQFKIIAEKVIGKARIQTQF